MKATFELSLDQFKQQYMGLLAQQLPLAEIDKMPLSALTVSFKNGNDATTVNKIIIVANIPETDRDIDTETSGS